MTIEDRIERLLGEIVTAKDGSGVFDALAEVALAAQAIRDVRLSRLAGKLSDLPGTLSEGFHEAFLEALKGSMPGAPGAGSFPVRPLCDRCGATAIFHQPLPDGGESHTCAGCLDDDASAAPAS